MTMELRTHERGERFGTVIALLWVIAIAVTGVPLFLGLSDLAIFGGLVSVAFIIALIWHLSHTGLLATNLPNLSPIALPNLGFKEMLGTIVVMLGLLFVIGIMLHPWVVLGVALALIALRIIVFWRRRLSVRLVVMGLAAGLVVSLATRYIGTGDLFMTMFYLAVIPFLFIGGGLLLDHTSLARVHVLEGQYGLGLVSFLWACVLAVPPALLNILGDANASDMWIDRWWEPLYALVPGIAEETLARLFLTSLCYALLRPATNDRPRRAIIVAVLIGALTHSLAHLPTLKILSLAGVTMSLAGLMYGIPMALLFIKRDMEHAVGYHFFIDFVRFLAALFWL